MSRVVNYKFFLPKSNISNCCFLKLVYVSAYELVSNSCDILSKLKGILLCLIITKRHML